MTWIQNTAIALVAIIIILLIYGLTLPDHPEPTETSSFNVTLEPFSELNSSPCYRIPAMKGWSAWCKNFECKYDLATLTDTTICLDSPNYVVTLIFTDGKDNIIGSAMLNTSHRERTLTQIVQVFSTMEDAEHPQVK